MDETDIDPIFFGNKKKKKKALIEDESEKIYDMLLKRIYNSLEKSESKISLSKPIVFIEGVKKTNWNNFNEICNQINRKIDHVYTYFTIELNCKGSINGDNNLILIGRYRTIDIEKILTSYIKEYVKCRACNSLNTDFIKENRLLFINCKICESRRSIPII